MTKRFQIYKCNICGNIIEILHEGAGQLVCCGKPMDLVEEKSSEKGLEEKHIPQIKGKKIKIGSILHPMEKEHFIEWIEAFDENGDCCIKFLNPGKKPEVVFNFNPVSARAYCNIHGLWEKA